MTTRGMKEAEMEIIAGFLVKGVEIAKRVQN
jgi:glycine/serine hydroxymethyltransferase